MAKMPEYLHFHVVANAKGTEVVELQDVSDHDWVDVVRCRDCLHYTDHDCPISWGKTDDDFCSFGERREPND